MDFSLSAIWDSMGFLARSVAVVLLLFAIASLGVFIERLLFFRKVIGRAGVFARASTPLLEGAKHDELLTLCRANAGIPLAEVVLAGLTAYGKGVRDAAAGTGTLHPVELTRRTLDRRVETLQAELRRGFGVLASVGSIAPFVGLFGTVVGIINAFEGIARTGSGGLGSVSAGIAEALVVTAFGLAVAIPAVLAFNYLTTRVERLDLALDQSSGELLDHLEHTHGVARKA
jgi:biopolymer transport protein ExbB